MTTNTTTRSQEVAAEVAALLRARNPLIWIVTREEARVERYLFEAAIKTKYIPRTWDIAAGVQEYTGKQFETAELREPGATLDRILKRATEKEASKTDKGLWIMRDLPPWISGPGGIITLRQLRNVARTLPGTPVERAQAVVVLSPSGDVPPELSTHAMVIEWPLPDRDEITGLLDASLGVMGTRIVLDADKKNAAVDAALGLSGEEAQACYAKSLVQVRTIDPVIVSKEKKRVIARERVLEWFDPLPGGLDAVGGLDQLKTWLISRSMAHTPEARDYGLQAPKGAFLAGVPGCGKSLVAKATATAWSCPLLRFDLNALKSKFVGESEANFRKALGVVDAIGRCVVWIDEIEKALQGATSGSADGGVSTDALGALLSWMQERSGEAFVIATANDIESLPPELLRKGRFDELWFVDLPNRVERMAILRAAIRSQGRDANVLRLDLLKVASNTNGFTGAELAAIIPEAMFVAFADGQREINTEDLVNTAATVTPLSETAKEKLTKLRDKAKGRFRSATSRSVTENTENSVSRLLDMEEA